MCSGEKCLSAERREATLCKHYPQAEEVRGADLEREKKNKEKAA